MNFLGCLRLLRQNLDPDGCSLAVVICWRLWWHRNQIVHGQSNEVEEDVVSWASNFLESYRVALFPSPIKRGGDAHNSVWMPPAGARVQINCDVGFLTPDSY